MAEAEGYLPIFGEPTSLTLESLRARLGGVRSQFPTFAGVYSHVGAEFRIPCEFWDAHRNALGKEIDVRDSEGRSCKLLLKSWWKPLGALQHTIHGPDWTLFLGAMGVARKDVLVFVLMGDCLFDVRVEKRLQEEVALEQAGEAQSLWQSISEATPSLEEEGDVDSSQSVGGLEEGSGLESPPREKSLSLLRHDRAAYKGHGIVCEMLAPITEGIVKPEFMDLDDMFAHGQNTVGLEELDVKVKVEEEIEGNGGSGAMLRSGRMEEEQPEQRPVRDLKRKRKGECARLEMVKLLRSSDTCRVCQDLNRPGNCGKMEAKAGCLKRRAIEAHLQGECELGEKLVARYKSLVMTLKTAAVGKSASCQTNGPANGIRPAGAQLQQDKSAKKAKEVNLPSTPSRNVVYGECVNASPRDHTWGPTPQVKYYSNAQEAVDAAVEFEKKLVEKGRPAVAKMMEISHVSGGFWLTIGDWAEEHMPAQKRCIVLEDHEGEFWEVVSHRCGLSGGWKAFARDHGLVYGDAVVFEAHTPLYIKVHLFLKKVREHEPDKQPCREDFTPIRQILSKHRAGKPIIPELQCARRLSVSELSIQQDRSLQKTRVEKALQSARYMGKNVWLPSVVFTFRKSEEDATARRYVKRRTRGGMSDAKKDAKEAPQEDVHEQEELASKLAKRAEVAAKRAKHTEVALKKVQSKLKIKVTKAVAGPERVKFQSGKTADTSRKPTAVKGCGEGAAVGKGGGLVTKKKKKAMGKQKGAKVVEKEEKRKEKNKEKKRRRAEKRRMENASENEGRRKRTKEEGGEVGEAARAYYASLYVSQRRPLTEREKARTLRSAHAFADRLNKERKGSALVRLMEPSHVYRGFWLGLLKKDYPTPDYFPMDDARILLEDSRERAFEVQHLFSKSGLSGGWRAFAIDHGLEEDDVIVFERKPLTSLHQVGSRLVSRFSKGSRKPGTQWKDLSKDRVHLYRVHIFRVVPAAKRPIPSFKLADGTVIPRNDLTFRGRKVPHCPIPPQENVQRGEVENLKVPLAAARGEVKRTLPVTMTAREVVDRNALTAAANLPAVSPTVVTQMEETVDRRLPLTVASLPSVKPAAVRQTVVHRSRQTRESNMLSLSSAADMQTGEMNRNMDALRTVEHLPPASVGMAVSGRLDKRANQGPSQGGVSITRRRGIDWDLVSRVLEEGPAEAPASNPLLNRRAIVVKEEFCEREPIEGEIALRSPPLAVPETSGVSASLADWTRIDPEDDVQQAPGGNLDGVFVVADGELQSYNTQCAQQQHLANDEMADVKPVVSPMACGGFPRPLRFASRTVKQEVFEDQFCGLKKGKSPARTLLSNAEVLRGGQIDLDIPAPMEATGSGYVAACPGPGSQAVLRITVQRQLSMRDFFPMKVKKETQRSILEFFKPVEVTCD